ncbi:MAG: RidA family protein [Elusimicrobia bacterium]|nr:RidA family protein [Elusimicrobiota bacterium]
MAGTQAVETSDAPKAIGPYSQAVRAGGWVFASGQIPLDPATGAIAGTTVAEQTDRVLRNLAAVLEAAGVGLGRVVKTTVYLADLGRFAEMNDVYAKHFSAAGGPFPARATVQVAALPKGALVEIDAIAA